MREKSLNIFKANIYLYIIVFIILLLFSIKINSQDIIKLNNNQLKQGEVIIIESNNKNISNLIKFDKQTYNFNTYNDKKILFIPISYWINPGLYSLEFQSDHKKYLKQIEIINSDFDKSYIEVDDSKKELIEPKKDETKQRKINEQKKVKQARKSSIKTKLWTGSFIWPVKGIITTKYGATRYVNNKLQSKHSGIDIVADTGKSVFATNNGIIRLTDNLLVTGNTVIIDHGFDIFSSYSHLSEIKVKSGDKVKKGQKIGNIGSSGFSTGPHLHWTVSIKNVFINPQFILDNNFFDL